MKLLRIKWELIITLLAGVFSIDCMLSHKIEEPAVLMTEIMIYGIILAIIYTMSYGIRKELLNK